MILDPKKSAFIWVAAWHANHQHGELEMVYNKNTRAVGWFQSRNTWPRVWG